MLGTTELIRRGNGRRLLAQRPAAGRRQVALQRQHVGEVGAPRAPAKVFRRLPGSRARRARRTFLAVAVEGDEGIGA